METAAGTLQQGHLQPAWLPSLALHGPSEHDRNPSRVQSQEQALSIAGYSPQARDKKQMPPKKVNTKEV